MGRETYLIWDWNGTLLDDTRAALAALNVQLAKRGLPTVGLDFYRRHFAFPARTFYARCGIDLAHEDWDRLALEYHDAYEAEPKALNAETPAALALARERAAGQSIVSALRQDLLDEITARLGVAPYMDHVYGVDNLDGASKLRRARELLDLLRTERPAARFVLIGDALHDKEVADALGVACVLFSGGSHSAERLAAVAPTGATLPDAVHLALADQGGAKDCLA